jgi:hypothetical protein
MAVVRYLLKHLLYASGSIQAGACDPDPEQLYVSLFSMKEPNLTRVTATL